MSRVKFIDEFNKSPIAKHRLTVLELADYCKNDTFIANKFGISARTIRRWRKAYRDSARRVNGNEIRLDPNVLIPLSRRPHHTRSSKINVEIIEEIRRIRYSHGCLGKRKIKPALDKFCEANGYKCISEATIGNIIRRKQMRRPYTKKYHYPTRAKRHMKFKQRVRYSPKINYNAYLEIDTIVRYESNGKIYIFNAVDVRNKWMYSRAYFNKSTRCSQDFLERLEENYPIEGGIVAIQTDNGSEFEKCFDDYLKKKSIEHNYIPPHTPRVNGYVERANRSLKEEFLYEYEYLIDSKGVSAFNDELDKYLNWYNKERPHESLENASPLEFLYKEGVKVTDDKAKYETTPCHQLPYVDSTTVNYRR